jgi:hypothetical protein
MLSGFVTHSSRKWHFTYCYLQVDNYSELYTARQKANKLFRDLTGHGTGACVVKLLVVVMIKH